MRWINNDPHKTVIATRRWNQPEWAVQALHHNQGLNQRDVVFPEHGDDVVYFEENLPPSPPKTVSLFIFMTNWLHIFPSLQYTKRVM